MYPNEYLFALGISCLNGGLYYGPVVALCLLGSLGNFNLLILKII